MFSFKESLKEKLFDNKRGIIDVFFSQFDVINKIHLSNFEL